MFQVAEENGLDALKQLAAHPVSQRAPEEASSAGMHTLTTAEEDHLSRRFVNITHLHTRTPFIPACLPYRLAALRQPS